MDDAAAQTPRRGRPAGKPKTGGRGKGVRNKRSLEIGQACMKAAPEALERLKALMRSNDPHTAKGACALILAYAYGKPRERVEMTGPNNGPLRFTLALGDPAVEHRQHGD
jgi:hypothetical protein